MNYHDLIAQAMATSTDMTKSKEAGHDKIILPDGRYNCHLTEVIEYGKKYKKFNGEVQDKQPPVLNVKLGFTCYDEKSNPVTIRSYLYSISNHPKATFKQIFDRIHKVTEVNHIAQALGKEFSVDVSIVERKNDVTGEVKKFNTMDLKTIGAPLKFNPTTGEKYIVPPVDPDLIKLFLWYAPTKECWDKLYIEGNNFVQEEILRAVDYQGSKLQDIIEGRLPEMAEMGEGEEPEMPSFED